MIEIPVGGPRASRAGLALVDDADYDLVSGHKWHIRVSQTSRVIFYAACNIRRDDGTRTTMSMHRMIVGYPLTDHIDLNGLNNRRDNLRPATKSQNAANRDAIAGTSSRFKGVLWHKRKHDGIWRAAIRVGDRRCYLGQFEAEEDAARAYDAAAVDLFGEFARLNFTKEETGDGQ